MNNEPSTMNQNEKMFLKILSAHDLNKIKTPPAENLVEFFGKQR